MTRREMLLKDFVLASLAAILKNDKFGNGFTASVSTSLIVGVDMSWEGKSRVLSIYFCLSSCTTKATAVAIDGRSSRLRKLMYLCVYDSLLARDRLSEMPKMMGSWLVTF